MRFLLVVVSYDVADLMDGEPDGKTSAERKTEGKNEMPSQIMEGIIETINGRFSCLP